MFDQDALRDELQSLKVDLASMLSTASEDLLNSSRSRAEALADQIKTSLGDLGDILSHELGQEDGQIGKLVADRPVALLASAFALGVVVGLALGRH